MDKRKIIAWKTTDRDGIITHTGITEHKGMVNEQWLKENNLTLHQKEFVVNFDSYGDGEIQISNLKHCGNCGSEMGYVGNGMYICTNCKPDHSHLPEDLREDIEKQTGDLQKALEEISKAREIMTADCKCRNDDNLLTCPDDCKCNCHKSNGELLELYKKQVKK